MQISVFDEGREILPQENFNLIKARTSENSPLSNKIEIIFIIEHITEKEKLFPTSCHQHVKILCISP